MDLSFAELKELIHLGQEIGLQQLQTKGLVVVYGQRHITQVSPLLPLPNEKRESKTEDDIVAYYASIGKGAAR